MKQLALGKFQRDVLVTLLLSSAVSLGLLLIRIIVTGSGRLSFMAWNLILAWLPLLLAFWLYERLRASKRPSWQDLLIAGLWLVFLPNTFYIITDLIHLQSSGQVGLLYDTAMLASFVINGLFLGYISVFIVHTILKRFASAKLAYIFVQTTLLLSAFAIYLGRYLRWNTWDLVANPIGVVFDVSDRIINPGTHIETFVVTGALFVVIGSTYAVAYQLITLAANQKNA